jgi:hypothetical protein
VTDRRANHRIGLHALYLPVYDAICAKLPPEWQPYNGARTFIQQGQIYAQGRTAPGKIVSNAPAGESAHCYGCGSDWTLWDGCNPIWMTKADPRWEDYGVAVVSAGARWGAEFGDIDHNELKIYVTWPKILQEFTDGGGMDAATKLMAGSLLR